MAGRRAFLSLMALAGTGLAVPARAQERFSLFVGTSPENVQRMVELAAVRDGETVMDLGSGDGRIVFAATRAGPRVRGIGVDIDANLVLKANEAARGQGLTDRVRFVHQNAFDADLAKADVIFMWLFPELMRLLRPKILAEAKPGARIVAATWDFGAWTADAADDRGGGVPTIRKWIVPARIEGAWAWEIPLRGRSHRFVTLLEQRMQQLEGIVRVGVRREVLQYALLRGDQVQFTLRISLPQTGFANLVFNGQIQGDKIEGIINAQLPRTGENEEGTDDFRLPWRASRIDTTEYFAFTGTAIR